MLRMGEPERERSERLSQNHPLKPVEPGSEERAARVETTRQPKNRPDPKPPWFRHDLLADAREDRLNQLCERFGTTRSLTLMRMLNQLPRPATASPP